MKRSVEAGRVVTLDRVDCIIDGLRVKRVGEQTFEIVREFVDEIVTLPDEQIFEAVVWTMHYTKLVPEGAAAAPVAALLHGLDQGAGRDRRVVVRAARRQRQSRSAEGAALELRRAPVIASAAASKESDYLRSVPPALPPLPPLSISSANNPTLTA